MSKKIRNRFKFVSIADVRTYENNISNHTTGYMYNDQAWLGTEDAALRWTVVGRTDKYMIFQAIEEVNG